MSNIILKDSEKNISISEITLIENELGINLPQDFKNLYLVSNGGIPDKRNILNRDNGEFITISNFFPIKYSKLENNLGYSTIEDIYSNNLREGLLDKKYIPFAEDWGGNYFCIDLSTQRIFIVFMDVEEEQKILLAENFTDFINDLK
ncbi:SMI1/KNR4 family protein [Flavobacterium oreochromis]|uniref:SMI1/KNR4 family protein n=1 Tax=Flavobacterium oreochromis TaxID=2906078 RepID=UPI000CDAD8FA|nr:hypothetical protein BWK58_13835 [Flavobacterium columnare]